MWEIDQIIRPSFPGLAWCVSFGGQHDIISINEGMLLIVSHVRSCQARTCPRCNNDCYKVEAKLISDPSKYLLLCSDGITLGEIKCEIQEGPDSISDF